MLYHEAICLGHYSWSFCIFSFPVSQLAFWLNFYSVFNIALQITLCPSFESFFLLLCLLLLVLPLLQPSHTFTIDPNLSLFCMQADGEITVTSLSLNHLALRLGHSMGCFFCLFALLHLHLPFLSFTSFPSLPSFIILDGISKKVLQMYWSIWIKRNVCLPD